MSREGRPFQDPKQSLMEKLLLRGYSPDDILFLDIPPSASCLFTTKEVVVVNSLDGDIKRFAEDLFKNGYSRVCIFHEKLLLVTFVNESGKAAESPVIPSKAGTFGKIFETVEKMRSCSGFGAGSYELAKSIEQYHGNPDAEGAFSVLTNSDLSDEEKADAIIEFCRTRYERLRLNGTSSPAMKIKRDIPLEELPVLSNYFGKAGDISIISPTSPVIVGDISRQYPESRISVNVTASNKVELFEKYAAWSGKDIVIIPRPANRSLRCFTNDAVLMLEQDGLETKDVLNQFFAAYRSLRKDGVMFADVPSNLLVGSSNSDFKKRLLALGGLLGIIWRGDSMPDRSALLVLSPNNPHPGKIVLNIINESNCEIFNESDIDLDAILGEIFGKTDMVRRYTAILDIDDSACDLTCEGLSFDIGPKIPLDLLGNPIFSKGKVELYDNSESGLPCFVNGKGDYSISKLPRASYSSESVMKGAYAVFAEAENITVVSYINGLFVLGEGTFAIPVDPKVIFANGRNGGLTSYGSWFFYCCSRIICMEVDRAKSEGYDLEEYLCNISIPDYCGDLAKYYDSKLTHLNGGLLSFDTWECRSTFSYESKGPVFKTPKYKKVSDCYENTIDTLWRSVVDSSNKSKDELNRIRELEQAMGTYWDLYYSLNDRTSGKGPIAFEEHKAIEEKIQEVESNVIELCGGTVAEN